MEQQEQDQRITMNIDRNAWTKVSVIAAMKRVKKRDVVEMAIEELAKKEQVKLP